MNDTAGEIVTKKPETTVYIFNLSEDVWSFINAFSNPRARELEIEENSYLADRDIFSQPTDNPVILITSKLMSDAYVSYVQGLVGLESVALISPKEHKGEICEDILRDEALMQKLIDAANGSKKLTLTAYSTTMQFLHLVDVLREKGLTVVTPESPNREDAWTVNFYGSKGGIRQLAQQSGAVEPDFVMSPGVIASGIVDAAKIAAKIYIKERGVVLKTNKGHSGMGIFLFREGDLPTEYRSCEQAIYEKLAVDPYWNMFPIIIEELISAVSSVGGGFPNVEFKILKNGRIDFLYYGGMRVTKDGVYLGMEIHNEALPPRIAAQLVDTGYFIAERYAAAGYRGYFDVDFVAARTGKLYVTESNVRRTGGSHVYHMATKLFGKDFMYETYILSNNSYVLPGGAKPTFAQIVETLSPILFDKTKKEGLVIASENLLGFGKLAYVIFGNSKKKALELESQMEELLGAKIS